MLTRAGSYFGYVPNFLTLLRRLQVNYCITLWSSGSGAETFGTWRYGRPPHLRIQGWLSIREGRFLMAQVGVPCVTLSL